MSKKKYLSYCHSSCAVGDAQRWLSFWQPANIQQEQGERSSLPKGVPSLAGWCESLAVTEQAGWCRASVMITSEPFALPCGSLEGSKRALFAGILPPADLRAG